jgi:hypothetical protein
VAYPETNPCVIHKRCKTCEAKPAKPPPLEPDPPCIEIKVQANVRNYMGTYLEVEVYVDGKLDCQPSGLCHVLDAFDRSANCWGQSGFPCNSGSTGNWHGNLFEYKSKKNGGRIYEVEVKVSKEGAFSSYDCPGWMCFAQVYRGKNAICDVKKKRDLELGA